jgi:hypothetical protein
MEVGPDTTNPPSSARFRYSENPLRSTENLEVVERPFTWLPSAREVQKLLSAGNDNIRTLEGASTISLDLERRAAIPRARIEASGSLASGLP